MPKIKTHKGSAKVFKKRKNDYKIGKPGTRHNTGKKSTSHNHRGRAGSVLNKTDIKRLKERI